MRRVGTVQSPFRVIFSQRKYVQAKAAETGKTDEASPRTGRRLVATAGNKQASAFFLFGNGGVPDAFAQQIEPPVGRGHELFAVANLLGFLGINYHAERLAV